MWRRNAVIMALVLVHGAAGTSVSRQPEPRNLLAKQSWVRFDMVLGRLTVTHLRGGNARSVKEAEHSELRESLSINGDCCAPSIRYQRSDERSSIEFEIANSTNVVISKVPQEDSREIPVSFRQQSHRPIVLAVGSGESRQEYRAASVWHLLLTEPALCRRHLLPLFQMLRPDWNLLETTDRIELELFRVAEGEAVVTRAHVLELVDQLDAEGFAQRQAADRELRGLGIAVLPYLQQLDLGTLNGEQRLRVRRIQLHLAVPTADTPVRVSKWLVNDKSVWLTLLSHREAEKRETAVGRLAGIHPGTIRFDPFGEESLRRRQIAELRSKLVGN